MIKLGAISGQLYTWSATHVGRIHRNASAATRIAVTGTPAFRRGTPRLAHRTLQALRQTRLQMCPGPRAWPQVLSFGESPERTAGDGVCAPGPIRASRRISRQLPPDSPPPRRALRHQPRALAPPRGVLSDGHGRDDHSAHWLLRPPPRGYPHRQHARRLAGRPRITQLLNGGLS